MSRLAFAAACSVLALGTAAQAQVTNVTGSASTTVKLDSTFTSSSFGPGIVSQGGGAAYYSSFGTTPSTVSFESANASIRGDNQVSSTSTSSVDISIKNGGSNTLNPVLQSDITGASLGFYLANTAGGCGGSGLFSGGDPYGGCGQTTGGQTFRNFNVAGVPFGTVLAGSAFEFTVAVGTNTVYNFTGIETVTEGDGFAVVNPLQMALNGVAIDSGVLQNLTNTTPGMAGSANGWMWDDSPVSIALGSLGAGGTEDVTYTATVTTFSDLGCTSSDSSVCLVSYGAFGDPIGKGGGTSNVARFFASPFDDTGDGIKFVDNWGPQTFATPTFNFGSGLLSFNAVVPEPETWMSMILGFGLLGGALRRRRILSYT
jgi:hypothetical protein